MTNMIKNNLSNYKYWFMAFLSIGLLLMSTLVSNNYAKAADTSSFRSFQRGSYHYLNINLMRSWLFMQGEYDIAENIINIWSRKRLFSDMLNFSLTGDNKPDRPAGGYSYISPLNLESVFGLGEYNFIYNENVFDLDESKSLIISDSYRANDFFNSVVMDSEIRIRNYSMGFIINAGYYKNRLNFAIADGFDNSSDTDINENKARLESSGFISQIYFYNDIKVNNNIYLSSIIMGSNSYPRATFFQNLALADTSKVFGYQIQLAYLRSAGLEKNDIRIGFLGRVQGMWNYRVNNLNIHPGLLEDNINREHYIDFIKSDRLGFGGTVMLIMNNYFARGRLYFLMHASVNRLLRDSFEYQTASDVRVEMVDGVGLRDEPYLNSVNIGVDLGLMTFSNWDLILRSSLYFGHGGVKGSFSLGVKIII